MGERVIRPKKSVLEDNKPDILLIDISDDVSQKLKSEGFNISEGSFGSPYNVELFSGYSHVIGKTSLPLISEQDIVIIDLLGAELLDKPVGNSEFPEDIKDIVCCHNAGWIDPRPKYMDRYRKRFDRILEYGGVFIIFSEPRYILDFWYATFNDYGSPVGERLRINNWSFLSILDEHNLKIEADQGKEINHVSDLLEDYFKDSLYNSVFHPNDIIKDKFHCLLKNKFGGCVGCLIESEGSGSNGYVLILPRINVTAKFIKNLLNEVLPVISPHLFPNIEGKWVERVEYEIKPILDYKNQINEIREKADTEIKLINKQIKDKKKEFNFLKGILTETGDDLVNDVEGCLKLIGFNKVVNVDNEIKVGKAKEEDLRICDSSIRLLLEIKGPSTLNKDEYIMQLVKYISRRRKEWETFDVNGTLIINHQRNIPPLERDNNSVFKKEQIKDAIEHDIGLITTWDLFVLIRGMLDYGWDPKVIRELFFEIGQIPDVPANYKPIGEIFTYIKDENIVGIKIKTGKLYNGQRIGYKLKDRFLEECVNSLQKDNKDVQEAFSGSRAGIKTIFSKNDLKVGLIVYEVTEN